MGLEDDSKGPEESDTSGKRSIQETQEAIAGYVKIALEFYGNLDFSNLSHEDYKDICTWFHTSGESAQLREFLQLKGIKMYGDYYKGTDSGYIIEHGEKLYIEKANHIVPREEFQSGNKFRYIRLLEISGVPRCVTVVGNRYFYAYAEPLDKNRRLFFIKRLDGTSDVLDKAYRKVFELGAWDYGVHIDGESFRFYLNNSKTLYIDYDGFKFSQVQQVGEKYYYGTQINTHTSTPTLH